MSTKNWIKFLFVSLLWGSTFLWIKLALREMGPYFIVTSRILFSALILIIPVIYFKYRLKRKMLRSFIILGLINAVIPYILITWGEIYIPSWLASILLSIVPFFTNLFAALFFKEENFSLQKLSGLLLGFFRRYCSYAE